MKLAIYSPDFQWAGGVDFLHGLVKGLQEQTKQPCEIFILVHDPSIVIKDGLKRKVVNYTKKGVGILLKPSRIQNLRIFKRPGLQNVCLDYDQLHNIREIFTTEDVTLVYFNNSTSESKFKVLKKVGADVILPVLSNSFPSDFTVPWIGYLFDFVYKYHTHLYTKDFCLKTDINYATTLMNAKSVIVNSKATFNDLHKYFPYSKAKIFSLPFAPYTNEHIYKTAASENEIKNKYKVGEQYFIISNQFWLHKSHETAFEALSILRTDDKYKDVQLVCTGRMTDLSGTESRKKELFQKVFDLGLQNYVHFVGHISKFDQLALMLRCIAVIQPTLFEGGPGGGSVYMAVANGIPAIVSDIAVNKEITNEPLVTFFEASKAVDLSVKMAMAIGNERSILPYEVIYERNKRRLNLLGNKLMECIDYTLNKKI